MRRLRQRTDFRRPPDLPDVLHEFGVYRVHRVDGFVIRFAGAARRFNFVEAHLIAGRPLQFAGLRHPIGQQKFTIRLVEQGDVGAGFR